MNDGVFVILNPTYTYKRDVRISKYYIKYGERVYKFIGMSEGKGN